MNRARILKLPRKSNGPASFFPRTRSTRFFLRNLSTVFLSMLLPPPATDTAFSQLSSLARDSPPVPLTPDLTAGEMKNF